jgi:hypothetical protein
MVRLWTVMKLTSEQFTGIAAGVLLLVTVTGDAKIMFAVSVVGLLMGLNFLRKDREQNGVFAVTIGFFFVFIIALVIGLKK